MENDSKSDNIVVGPWAGSNKNNIKEVLSEDDKVLNDMNYIDKVAENIMVQMIHFYPDAHWMEMIDLD